MKTFSVKFLGLLLLFGSTALLEAQSVTGQTAQTKTPPPPTPYAVVAKDANSSVWQRTVYELDPQGNPVPKIHGYTEVATGLHFQRNGQWQDSKEEIDILPNGTAAATNGQHQAYFPGDIYQGQVEVVTPDGLQLYSRPLALSYDDGTNTVMIAELTNSIGQVLGANQVIYTNAFTGFAADLIYTYTKAGFEQDVVLREQPPTPESLGINPSTSRLQILTEFYLPPQPAVQSTAMPVQAGLSLTDDSLGFGTMKMVRGRAFLLGQNTQNTQASVSKQWEVLDGRQFLVEEVPVDAIVKGLAALPLTARQPASTSSVTRIASKHLKLPPQRQVRNGSKTMLVASAKPPAQGFVLDYQTLNDTFTGYTFMGDTTYFVSGLVTLWGTNTIEGGTVIKYTNSSSAELSFNPGEGPMGPLICQTGPYRPAIFTSMDDDSVGESINGSSSSPTNTLATYLYNPENTGGGSYPPLQYLRFCYAGTAIYQGNTTVLLPIRNCQFLQCAMAINDCAVEIFGNIPVQQLYNVLISKCGNGLADAPDGYDVVVDGENLTVDQTGVVLAGAGTGGSLSGNFTNCIFTAYGYLLYAPDESGSVTLYDCVTNASGSGIFQTIGGGNYYLAAGSTNRSAGTTNIDPTLLSDLREKTTYPPLVFTNATFSVTTNLSPQAGRDTNAAPDLGYHYDPLDYVFGGCLLTGATLTFAPGTAVGLYEELSHYRVAVSSPYGLPFCFWLDDGANLTFDGTASLPCWVTRFNLVQESVNGNWRSVGLYGDWGRIGGLTLNGNATNTVFNATTPKINAQFTKWSFPNFISGGNAGGVCAGYYFNNSGGGNGVVYIHNSEFYNASVSVSRAPVNFTNCLFSCVDFYVQENWYYDGFAFQN